MAAIFQISLYVAVTAWIHQLGKTADPLKAFLERLPLQYSQEIFYIQPSSNLQFTIVGQLASARWVELPPLCFLGLTNPRKSFFLKDYISALISITHGTIIQDTQERTS
jgi:hypothetical protein